jgi:hypothetical protein
VERVGPPRSRITPKEVKQNRKVMVAAATMPGRSAGSVTSRNARHRLAPSIRAASSSFGSRCRHSSPTTRTTTA